jgi:hypothetical protein
MWRLEQDCLIPVDIPMKATKSSTGLPPELNTATLIRNNTPTAVPYETDQYYHKSISHESQPEWQRKGYEIFFNLT